MGLGKTLTVIALVATDLEPERSLITEDDLWDDPEDSKPPISATLVIVPQPRM
jgi:SNF2 family DNA or RNA helicase